MSWNDWDIDVRFYCSPSDLGKLKEVLDKALMEVKETISNEWEEEESSDGETAIVLRGTDGLHDVIAEMVDPPPFMHTANGARYFYPEIGVHINGKYMCPIAVEDQPVVRYTVDGPDQDDLRVAQEFLDLQKEYDIYIKMKR